MTESRSPKFIGTKLGLVSALALGSLPLIGSEALAIPVGVASDTLQIGTGTTFTIAENGSEPTTISSGPVSIGSTITITSLTGTIALLDPGTNSISDIVTASISCGEGGGVGAEGCASPVLTVTLRSDGETPLAPPSGMFSTLTETGSVQNLSSQSLSSNFTTLLGVTGSNPLPAINVLSDVEAVPEPASLALLGSGLAGLAFVRRRRKA